MIKVWTCSSCGWQGEETEIRKDETFKETRLEPAEWEWRCPDCNKTETLEEIDFPLCRTCEDVIVHHEGDQCTECYTCHQEALADEKRGH